MKPDEHERHVAMSSSAQVLLLVRQTQKLFSGHLVVLSVLRELVSDGSLRFLVVLSKPLQHMERVFKALNDNTQQVAGLTPAEAIAKRNERMAAQAKL